MKRILDYVEVILKATYDGTLDWHQVPNEKYARKIFEPWNVMRQFETPFLFNGIAATLVCVEKRFFIYDYLFPHEDRMCEMVVFSGGEIVKKIGPPFLPWFWLGNFGDIIAKACERPATLAHA